MDKDDVIKGGEFLIKETKAENVFIPEDFDEEQRMIADTCYDFIEKEVDPVIDRIEKQEEGLSVALMEKAGDLGILGISVPEEYGGFGKDFVTSMLTAEVIGGGHSFAVSISAHTGIGTLPILYYGNAEQREKVREITEKSDNAIIVASYGTFSTGINIRNLHNLVFASPSKSRIRNLQSIGRGLRMGDNKSQATLYDIADDLTHRDKKNYTLGHFQERINIYNEEGFAYEIHNVNLKA